MDVFHNGASDVVMMTSAQVGKTEILNNILGYHIDLDPAPVLVVQPTGDMAKSWSTTRLAPMLRDTPRLRGKVADPRSRDSGNTIDEKRFPGGYLAVVGANSPAPLAARPIRIVLADEIDRYPPSAGTEGDPLLLALARTKAFWNRRIFKSSTPTVKGVSRIEQEWERSDQRRYFCRCPHCGHEQHLTWAHVVWQKDIGPDGRATKHYPETACLYCEECGVAWSEPERRAAVRWGRWKPTRPGGRIVGFHLNELYSPWSRITEIAANFLEAKKSPETLKTWVNTVLGEPFEEIGEGLNDHILMQRERYGMSLEKGGEASADVLVVSAGVDVQDDRLEVEIVGWGIDEQSWSLDYRVLYGDPAGKVLWQDLDDLLLEPIRTADGRTLRVSAAAVDSGGHHTQAVYEFVRPRANRRIWAVKGLAGEGKPIWPKKASRNNKGKVLLYLIGVDSAKDTIYARLKIREPGPGYCHFPFDRERSWFEQLTAETVVREWVKGYPRRVWQKRPSARNEALDARVYAFAALLSLNVVWHRELKKAEAMVRAPPRIERAPDVIPDAEIPKAVAAKGKPRPRRVVRSSAML